MRPEPAEPSNRWPWIALAGGILVIVIAVVAFYANRPASNVNITLTPNPAAASGSPSPPPTLVPPTQPPSASLAPTATPLPATATPLPSATPAPRPTPLPPAAQTAVPVAVQAASPAPGAGQPGTAAPPAAAPPAAAPPAAAPPAAAPTVVAAAQPQPSPSPTPFNGQVSAGGGLGNTSADLQAAYGAPVGQTSNNLVVYRKNNFEYHVQLVPDLNGRAAVIVEMPVQQTPALTLQQAQAEAHRLLPKDAQPPNATPEGNNQFVVERYTSQTLAQALPAAGGGQFLIVYVKDQSGNNITRWILGAGNDPNALLSFS